MSAFPVQHNTHHFPLDSVVIPKYQTKMPSFMVDDSNMSNNCLFTQFYPQESVQQSVSLDSRVQQSSCLDHNSKAAFSDSELKKQNTECSSVDDMLEKGEQVTQKVNSMEKKRKNKSGSSLTSVQSKDNEEELNKTQKKNKGVEKYEQEKKLKADKNVEKKVPVEPPTGYIHVRARRGQATDSHSLAERVRREKISERMKILQSLVPGCEKVTGKTLVLDEIINYVQSLQGQVEFLSMKLAAMNSLFFDFGMDLDAFTLSPQRMNNTPPSQLPQCSPTQPISTTFADLTTTTTLNTTSNYPLLDSSLLLHQDQRPNVTAFTQDDGSLAWDVLDQRQRFLNQSGFANNLGSFR